MCLLPLHRNAISGSPLPKDLWGAALPRNQSSKEGARSCPCDHRCVHQWVDQGRRKQMGFCSAAEPWCRLGYEGKVSCPMLCCGQVVSITLLLFFFVLFCFFSPEKASNPNYCNRKKYKDGQPLLSETESPGSFWCVRYFVALSFE